MKLVLMKLLKYVISILSLIVSIGVHGADDRKISIFCDHIEEIARQRSISFSEAATLVRQLGYEGVDVRVSMDTSKQHTLDSLGFGHSSAIAEINFATGQHADRCVQALDFVCNREYERLHLVPGFVPQDADVSVLDSIYCRTAAFVSIANERGVDVLIEDYDSSDSPTYNTAALDSFYNAVPVMGHVLDTGNYLYCGEDPLSALMHFSHRVRHVHLKDRTALHDKNSPALGTGILALEDFIKGLMGGGYDGWLTVEHFSATDMLNAAATSIHNLNVALDKVDVSVAEENKTKSTR